MSRIDEHTTPTARPSSQVAPTVELSREGPAGGRSSIEKLGESDLSHATRNAYPAVGGPPTPVHIAQSRPAVVRKAFNPLDHLAEALQSEVMMERTSSLDLSDKTGFIKTEEHYAALVGMSPEPLLAHSPVSLRGDNAHSPPSFKTSARSPSTAKTAASPTTTHPPALPTSPVVAQSTSVRSSAAPSATAVPNFVLPPPSSNLEPPAVPRASHRSGTTETAGAARTAQLPNVQSTEGGAAHSNTNMVSASSAEAVDSSATSQHQRSPLKATMRTFHALEHNDHNNDHNNDNREIDGLGLLLTARSAAAVAETESNTNTHHGNVYHSTSSLFTTSPNGARSSLSPSTLTRNKWHSHDSLLTAASQQQQQQQQQQRQTGVGEHRSSKRSLLDIAQEAQQLDALDEERQGTDSPQLEPFVPLDNDSSGSATPVSLSSPRSRHTKRASCDALSLDSIGEDATLAPTPIIAPLSQHLMSRHGIQLVNCEDDVDHDSATDQSDTVRVDGPSNLALGPSPRLRKSLSSAMGKMHQQQTSSPSLLLLHGKTHLVDHRNSMTEKELSTFEQEFVASDEFYAALRHVGPERTAGDLVIIENTLRRLDLFFKCDVASDNIEEFCRSLEFVDAPEQGHIVAQENQPSVDWFAIVLSGSMWEMHATAGVRLRCAGNRCGVADARASLESPAGAALVRATTLVVEEPCTYIRIPAKFVPAMVVTAASSSRQSVAQGDGASPDDSITALSAIFSPTVRRRSSSGVAHDKQTVRSAPVAAILVTPPRARRQNSELSFSSRLSSHQRNGSGMATASPSSPPMSALLAPSPSPMQRHREHRLQQQGLAVPRPSFGTSSALLRTRGFSDASSSHLSDDVEDEASALFYDLCDVDNSEDAILQILSQAPGERSQDDVSTLVSTLIQLSAFESEHKSVCRRVCADMVAQWYHIEGTEIFSESTCATADWYVVLMGKVDLMFAGEVIDTLADGQAFGAGALVKGQWAAYSAVCRDTTTLCASVPRDVVMHARESALVTHQVEENGHVVAIYEKVAVRTPPESTPSTPPSPKTTVTTTTTTSSSSLNSVASSTRSPASEPELLLRSATPARLVYELFHDTSADGQFANLFLLTLPMHTESCDFADALYEHVPENLTKVVSLLKKWLWEYPEDFVAPGVAERFARVVDRVSELTPVDVIDVAELRAQLRVVSATPVRLGAMPTSAAMMSLFGVEPALSESERAAVVERLRRQGTAQASSSPSLYAGGGSISPQGVDASLLPRGNSPGSQRQGVVRRYSDGSDQHHARQSPSPLQPSSPPLDTIEIPREHLVSAEPEKTAVVTFAAQLERSPHEKESSPHKSSKWSLPKFLRRRRRSVTPPPTPDPPASSPLLAAKHTVALRTPSNQSTLSSSSHLIKSPNLESRDAPRENVRATSPSPSSRGTPSAGIPIGRDRGGADAMRHARKRHSVSSVNSEDDVMDETGALASSPTTTTTSSLAPRPAVATFVSPLLSRARPRLLSGATDKGGGDSMRTGGGLMRRGSLSRSLIFRASQLKLVQHSGDQAHRVLDDDIDVAGETKSDSVNSGGGGGSVGSPRPSPRPELKGAERTSFSEIKRVVTPDSTDVEEVVLKVGGGEARRTPVTTASDEESGIDVVRVYNPDLTSHFIPLWPRCVAPVLVAAVLERQGLTEEQTHDHELVMVHYSGQVDVVDELLASSLAQSLPLNARYYLRRKPGFEKLPVPTPFFSSSASSLMARAMSQELPHHDPLPSLLSFDYREIARHLVRSGHAQLATIRPREFVCKLFDCALKTDSDDEDSEGSDEEEEKDGEDTGQEKERQKERGRARLKRQTQHLDAFAERFNHLTRWVVTEIVTEQSRSKRCELIRLFVKLAKRLSDLGDYLSLFAVLSGLSSTAVRRLKETWERITPKYTRPLEVLEQLMNPSRNMGVYRAAVRAATGPLVPFFPLVLKDLYFLKEGNKVRKDGLVNVDLLRMLTRLVSDVRAHQMTLFQESHLIDKSGEDRTLKGIWRRERMRKGLVQYHSMVVAIDDEDLLMELSRNLEGPQAGSLSSRRSQKRPKSMMRTTTTSPTGDALGSSL